MDRANKCKHPPHRLYSWVALDLDGKQTILCVGCCECGVILKGGTNPHTQHR